MIDCKDKNKERIEQWRVKYYEATGRHPNVEPHNIAPCAVCGRLVWRPISMKIPTNMHFCASIECNEKLIDLIRS